MKSATICIRIQMPSKTFLLTVLLAHRVRLWLLQLTHYINYLISLCLMSVECSRLSFVINICRFCSCTRSHWFITDWWWSALVAVARAQPGVCFSRHWNVSRASRVCHMWLIPRSVWWCTVCTRILMFGLIKKLLHLVIGYTFIDVSAQIGWIKFTVCN